MEKVEWAWVNPSCLLPRNFQINSWHFCSWRKGEGRVEIWGTGTAGALGGPRGLDLKDTSSSDCWGPGPGRQVAGGPCQWWLISLWRKRMSSWGWGGLGRRNLTVDFMGKDNRNPETIGCGMGGKLDYIFLALCVCVWPFLQWMHFYQAGGQSMVSPRGQVSSQLGLLGFQPASALSWPAQKWKYILSCIFIFVLIDQWVFKVHVS